MTHILVDTETGKQLREADISDADAAAQNIDFYHALSYHRWLPVEMRPGSIEVISAEIAASVTRRISGKKHGSKRR